MRKGINKSKEQVISGSDVQHRVIIPLHIPFEEDYYKDAFTIFEMCLNSLTNTASFQFKITVISDGCCQAVNDRLYGLHQNKIINELIIESDNIGKINSVLKGLRTVNEEFVTITDADILFLDDWDKNVFDIFKSFKKAAVVSPIPVFRKHLSYTANIWLDYLFSNKLKFRDVKKPEAMEKFAKSLGWPFLAEKYKDVILTLKTKNTTAVVSAAHCVATYKMTYLKKIPLESTVYKLGGQSEGKYLDQPPYELDGYRLSTYDNFAYHMGNTLEDWFVKIYKFQKPNLEKKILPEMNKVLPKKKLIKTFLMKLFLKLLKFRSIYDFILSRKGLSLEKIKNFK